MFQSDVVEICSSDSDNNSISYVEYSNNGRYNKKSRTKSPSKTHTKENKKPHIYNGTIIDLESETENDTCSDKKGNTDLIDVEATINAKESIKKINELLDKKTYGLNDKLFKKLIKLTIKYEHTTQIINIISQLLVPSYIKADKQYIESEGFSKLLFKIISGMKQKEGVVYTGIKKIFTNLRANKRKRRVELITLDKDVDLDIIPSKDVRSEINLTTIDIEDNYEEILMTNVTDAVGMDCPSSEDTSNEHLLEVLSVRPNEGVDDSQAEINKIENCIEFCKRKIEYYEEQEVNLDCVSSAYLLADKYKSRLVQLYKQLCELSDTPEKKKKRFNIRLEVPSGHPPGPARKLEQWLNANLEDDEVVSFPDFHDVIQCVASANKEDDLKWSAEQVTCEAQSLFTQCGRELQRRRMKREWRDLIEIAPNIEDPADNSPELEAQLLKNKKVAEEQEKKLLQQYVQLERIKILKKTTVKSKPNCINQADSVATDLAEATIMSNIKQEEDNIQSSLTPQKPLTSIRDKLNFENDIAEAIMKMEKTENSFDVCQERRITIIFDVSDSENE